MTKTTELETTGRGIVAPLSLLSVEPGFNVREDTTPEAEFLDSVKTHGVLRPLHVRNNPEKPGHYLIVDGERRFNAATKAKLKEVPVIPEGDLDTITALVMSLVANEGAKHLSAHEEATAFKRLKDEGVPVDEIGRVMGRSKRKVEETLRALESGDEDLAKGVTTDDPEEKIPPRAAARAATLPKETRAKVVKEIKGKNAREGVAVVRKAEKEAGITRRGRKAKDYPWAKNAKGLAEMLEKAAKSVIRNGEAGNRRAEHHLEVIEVLKGKTEPGELYVTILEAQEREAKKATKTKATTKKKVAKKVTKKAAAKKTGKRASKKKKTTSKKAATKKAASTKETAKKAGAKKRIILKKTKSKAA